ncbi:MAG: LuxR C-terminal-related transcriptional regulator [Pseudolysinimonas sp.]
MPRVPDGMLVRRHLVERLGRAPLTVIRAPGGSGKTVLMAQWAAAQHGRDGAWITVEADTGDRATIWSAVARAVAPGERMLEPGRADVARVLHEAGRPFLLIVDDAHDLSTGLAEELIALVRSVPGLTLIVGTRSRGEFEAPRHAVALDTVVLAPEDLQLTVGDVQQIAGTGDAGNAEELLEASGGNPLLLRAIVAGSSPGVRPGITAEAVVRDHLRAVLERAGAEVAALACATGVADDLDLALAEQLGGAPGGWIRAQFDRFEGDGILMRQEGASGTRFRYHPLVRDALREQFRSEHPERYRRSCLIAGADAESRREYVAALRLAVEAEDYARASDVVLHGAFSLLRSRGAAAILERVPQRHVARLPFLAVVLGLAANARGERLRALQLLTMALAASRAGRGRQRVAERVGLALIESTVLRITGRAAESVSAARRMLVLLDEAAPADLEEIADQEAAYRHQAALSLFRGGDLLEARAAAERIGISAQAMSTGAPEALGAAALAAVIDAARGDMPAARRVLAALDAAPFPAELRDRYLGSLAHLARGLVALESGDAPAALAHTELYASGENLEHGMLFTALRAATSLWQGSPELGLRAIEQREQGDRPRARASAQDRRVAAAMKVLLHAALGQPGPARALVRELDRADPLTALLQAVLLLQQQDVEQAIVRLSAVPAGAGPRLRAAAELLTACAALLRDDAQLAEASLRRFLATAELHALLSPVLLVPAEHRERLWRFAESIGTDGDALASLRAVPAPLHLAPVRIALTPREEEVLRQLRDTASLPEIAATLSVSSNTVKTQVRTLYRKLEVGNRDDALRAAVLHGLFE